MKIKSFLPGISIAILISLVAWYLGILFPIIGGPVIGLFIGLLFGSLITDSEKLKTGIQFTSKKVLQYAVILLGFGLNLSQVFKVGLTSLPIILVTIATALVTAYFIQKLFKLDSEITTLVGVGSSICGGSAIAATAPVIKAKDESIATAISVIFFFNILAALLFPHLGSWLGLSNQGFAIFAGTAVNDTSSVTATASSWDSLHGTSILEQATIVKLTRTLAIIPITLGLSIWQSKKEDKKESFSLIKAVPNFIIWFLVASLITTVTTSLGASATVFAPLKNLSKFMIIMAMTAIGYQTNLKKLITKGGSALLVGGICWLLISVASLLMQKLLGLW
ncbi:YeiH family protein [Streptococcus vestibularis]|uniref:YeiH family protein n=1 Tax=Streptococcus vestibularis TaxID=1343 RepID=UPI000E44E893|nr:YeiH family protein [Streptococcus vestibularis]RGM53750.1 YeiH family protein [Streptococcus vestibularis]